MEQFIGREENFDEERGPDYSSRNRSRSRSRDREDVSSARDDVQQVESTNPSTSEGASASATQDREKFDLYVTNLAFETQESHLRDHFSPYGEILNTVVVKDVGTQRSRGFGFVSFADYACSEKALQELNGSQMDGRSIKVERARNSAREKTPGRYMGSAPSSRYSSGESRYSRGDRDSRDSRDSRNVRDSRDSRSSNYDSRGSRYDSGGGRSYESSTSYRGGRGDDYSYKPESRPAPRYDDRSYNPSTRPKPVSHLDYLPVVTNIQRSNDPRDFKRPDVRSEYTERDYGRAPPTSRHEDFGRPNSARPTYDTYPYDNAPVRQRAPSSGGSAGVGLDGASSGYGSRDLGYGRAPGYEPIPVSPMSYSSHARGAPSDGFDPIGSSSRPGYESGYYAGHSASYEPVTSAAYSSKVSRGPPVGYEPMNSSYGSSVARGNTGGAMGYHEVGRGPVGGGAPVYSDYAPVGRRDIYQ